MSLSPTDTIALASTRTLMGRGVPESSMSAVWSVMSRSTLMTLLEIVVPVVKSGISLLLPRPRQITVPPASQLTRRISPASTSRRNLETITGTTTRTNATTPMITKPFENRLFMRDSLGLDERDHAAIPLRVDLFDADLRTGGESRAHRAVGF